MPEHFLNDEQRAAIASVTEIPNTAGQNTAPEVTPLGPLEKKRLVDAGTPKPLVQMLEKDRKSIYEEQEFSKQLQDFEPATEEEYKADQVQRQTATELADFEEVDPLTLWDADTLSKDPEFSLEAYVSRFPEAIHDERSKKLAQIWKKANQEPITTKDVAIGVAKLPWTTAKTLYKFTKGTGQVLVDVFGTPVASALGAVTGQGSEFDEALNEISQKELSEDLAGIEQGTFGFAQFVERARRNVPRRLGFSSWDEIPEEQLQKEFADHFEGYLQHIRIGEGKGEFQKAVGGEILKEVEARGDVLDPERIATVAEADPAGFFLFGKAFQAGFGVAGAGKKALGKTPVARAAKDLNATRNSLHQIRNTLPPGEPIRDLADDLLKAATERTGAGARALEKVYQVGDAASRLVEAGARVRTLENAAKAFGSAERQATLAEAKSALAAAEANAAQFLGARGVASLKKLFTVPAGNVGQAAAGRVAQAASAGLRGAARTIESLPTAATLGAAVGTLLTGNVVGTLATLGTAGLAKPLLKKIATGAARPLRAAAGVADAGRAAVTATGGTAFQRGLQGVARGSAEVVAEALKATPMDVGFGLLLAESPDDVQNIAGYSAAFRALHFAGRPLARFTQAVKAGEGRAQGQFLPRNPGTVASAEAANRSHRRDLSPEQQARVESVESFLREMGSNTPVYVLDQASFFIELQNQFQKKNGRAPNEAELAELRNYSEQRGMFAEEVIGDNGEVGGAIFVTSPEAIAHEGAHPFQNVLGERGNEFVDQIIFDEFAGQWEQIGADYVSRLEGAPLRADWREVLQPIIPQGIRQEAGGDPVKAADIYLAREVAAEQFSVLFGATGGRPTANTTLTEKLANVIDRTAAFLGQNILESGPTTPGLGLEVSGRATEAIREAAQSQARRAGEAPVPILPRESGPGPVSGPAPAAPTPAASITPVAPTPARPTPGSPAPGRSRVPVPPITPVPPPAPVGGVRETPRSLDPLRATTRESLNIEAAREKAAESGDQNVIDNVEAIGRALQRSPGEAVVINAENLSVVPGRRGSAYQRTLRRAEQAVPEAVREFFSKRFAVTRFLTDAFSGGKLQLAAMSLDKVLANVFNLNERLANKKSSDLVPYETEANGQLSEAGWHAFTADLTAYTANQANGYRGGGQEIIRPETAVRELGIAIPEVNPTYKPVRLPETVEQYLNVIQAIPTPRTAREFSGIVPGNVKGQVLREAQGEKTFDPLDITPKGQAKQIFKSFPGRRVQETNPLRQEMTRRGVNTRELLEVTERLNLDRLQNVQVEPDLKFNLPSTDIIRAGFLPRESKGDTVELFRGQEGSGAASGTFWTQNKAKAASYAPDGTVFRVEVPRSVALEGKRRAEGIGQGGDTFLLPPGIEKNATPIKAETPVFQLLPKEFKPGEQVDLTSLREMPQEKFTELSNNYVGERFGGGLTGLAFDLGASVKSAAEVQSLRDQHAAITSDIAAAKEARDFNKMFELVSKSQFVREALEAATGEGGSEAFIRKEFDPNYEAPAKAAAAEGRQFQPAAKAGGKGKEDAAAKAWREKHTDSPFFKKWFGKSKVLDEGGDPKVVNHGTTHEFDTFDPSRANKESDFGAGIYFTDSKTDANFNYASRPSEGAGTSPDLRLKIDLRAEQITQEHFDNGGKGSELSYQDAVRMAEKELVGPVEKTIEAFVKMENPVIVGERPIEGAQRETKFTIEEKFDEATGDYVGEPTGTLLEFAEAFRRHKYEGEVEDILAAVFERAHENGGEIGAFELVKTIKEHPDGFELRDSNGDPIPGEVVRSVFEDMGFDGIIDQSVDVKFPNMRGIQGATHYIAFQPTQVKGYANSGRFDPKDPRFQALPKESQITPRQVQRDIDTFARDFRPTHRSEGPPRGFTDPQKFGIPESLRREDRVRETGQDEFQFLPREEVTAEQIRIANKTARAAGAVGGRLTRTAQAVLERVDPNSSVLDFGAGPKAVQSQLLRDAGFTNVKAHDFGDNVVEGVHTPNALNTQYDAVFASNVLNVQSSVPMLQSTLGQIASATAPGGKAIFNYPKAPRKMPVPLTPEELKANIQDHFTEVERVGGSASEPVFEARGPRRNRTEAQFLPPAKRPYHTNEEWAAMDFEQRMAHFPEAIVTEAKSVDKKGIEKHAPIEYNILGSPRAQKFAKEVNGKKVVDQEAAAEDFAVELVKKYLERANDPETIMGKQWYEDFFPLLRAHYREDAQLMAELLAATSPNTPPATNFQFADKALKRIKAGEFDDIMAKYEEGLTMASEGTLRAEYESKVPESARPKKITDATLMGWWIQEHNLLPTQRPRLDAKGNEVAPKFGFHGKAVLKVATRRWLKENKGLKTDNFVKNLTGEGIEATIDLWAIRTMRELGYKGFQERWRLLPPNEKGVTDPDFLFSQKVFKKAADKLGILPRQLQGAMWFLEKVNWFVEGWGRLDLGDYKTELEKQIRRERALKKEAEEIPEPTLEEIQILPK